MVLILILVFIVGAVLGGAGLRRAGRMVGGVSGPWRPALGGFSLVLLIAGVVLTARGAVAFGLVAFAAALGGALWARARGAPAPSPPGEMSVNEACATLGVKPTDSLEVMEAAYRRLVKRVHPDAGGAAGLAARLNLARDVFSKSKRG